MINLDQKITFPKLLVDVGHLGNPQGFVKLVILSLEPRKLEGNEPKINIFQVFDQNREVIAEMQELQGALNLLQVAPGYQVPKGVTEWSTHLNRKVVEGLVEGSNEVVEASDLVKLRGQKTKAPCMIHDLAP